MLVALTMVGKQTVPLDAIARIALDLGKSLDSQYQHRETLSIPSRVPAVDAVNAVTTLCGHSLSVMDRKEFFHAGLLCPPTIELTE